MQTAKLTAFVVAGVLVAPWSMDAANAQRHGGGGAAQKQEMQKREFGTAKEPQARSMKSDRPVQKLRERMRDREIYGRELMSAEERKRYRKRLDGAGSDKEWAQIREEHQKEVRARAEAQGRPIDPPVYGQHMITAEERQRFARRMESAATDAEREQVRSEHREMIRNRARELGIDPPPTS